MIENSEFLWDSCSITANLCRMASEHLIQDPEQSERSKSSISFLFSLLMFTRSEPVGFRWFRTGSGVDSLPNFLLTVINILQQIWLDLFCTHCEMKMWIEIFAADCRLTAQTQTLYSNLCDTHLLFLLTLTRASPPERNSQSCNRHLLWEHIMMCMNILEINFLGIFLQHMVILLLSIPYCIIKSILMIIRWNVTTFSLVLGEQRNSVMRLHKMNGEVRLYYRRMSSIKTVSRLQFFGYYFFCSAWWEREMRSKLQFMFFLAKFEKEKIVLQKKVWGRSFQCTKNILVSNNREWLVG